MKGMMMRSILMMLMLTIGFTVQAQNTATGVASEDALKVQSELYEPPIRVDVKSIQKIVYKTVFKHEMKDTRPSEAAEEE